MLSRRPGCRGVTPTPRTLDVVSCSSITAVRGGANAKRRTTSDRTWGLRLCSLAAGGKSSRHFFFFFFSPGHAKKAGFCTGSVQCAVCAPLSQIIYRPYLFQKFWRRARFAERGCERRWTDRHHQGHGTGEQPRRRPVVGATLLDSHLALGPRPTARVVP